VTEHAKQHGTYYEQAFILKCMYHGLHPHPSVGDYLPHDLIVQNSVGRMVRVQVKGTDSLQRLKKEGSKSTSYTKRGRYRITAMMGSKAKKQPIDCFLVDVLAIYVREHKTFYNIPCTDLSSTCIWVAPHDDTSKGKYEKYKENWDVYR
jgi:hypothetical protein